MDQEDVKISVMQTRSAMFCLGCGYALDGLAQNRCPECGRPFYPDSPNTYRATPHPRILPTHRTALALLLAMLPILISIAGGYILSVHLGFRFLPGYNLETISKGLVMPILLVSDLHKECQDGETQGQDADDLGSR